MSIDELSKAIGISTQEMWFTTSSKQTRYTHYTQRKSNGALRHIYAPDKQLKKVQYAVLRGALDLIELPNYLWAFERGKSVVDMARLHTGKTIVFSWDIKDYFTSIHQDLLEGLLQTYYDPQVAKYISELGTYKFFVPQGSLISPKLANIVTARTFGPDLETYFLARGGVFSVYADDITVSFRRPVLLPEAQEFTVAVASSLLSHGFRLNRSKTKFMPKYKRQYVCGIVVNEKSTILRRDKRLLRAIVHNVSRNGIEAEAEKSDMSPEEFKSTITGRLGWFRQVNSAQAAPLLTKWTAALSSQSLEPSHDTSAA